MQQNHQANLEGIGIETHLEHHLGTVHDPIDHSARGSSVSIRSYIRLVKFYIDPIKCWLKPAIEWLESREDVCEGFRLL